MTNFGGPRGRAKRRADLLKNQILGVSVRAAETGKPLKPLRLTPTRRGLLEAIHAGRVKFHPSAGWRCDGKGVNADVHDVCAAGWAQQAIVDGHRNITLTDAGLKALGLDDPA